MSNKNEETTIASMQSWADSIYGPNAKMPTCECGAHKLELGIYGHSTFCPLYIAPALITDKCECGVGPWHSVNCRFRGPESTEVTWK
jgi:hypothetical protein